MIHRGGAETLRRQSQNRRARSRQRALRVPYLASLRFTAEAQRRREKTRKSRRTKRARVAGSTTVNGTLMSFIAMMKSVGVVTCASRLLGGELTASEGFALRTWRLADRCKLRGGLPFNSQAYALCALSLLRALPLFFLGFLSAPLRLCGEQTFRRVPIGR